MVNAQFIPVVGEVGSGFFWVWVLYRRFFSYKSLPAIIAIPIRLIRIILIVVTFGLLAGCANPDPLAVASGPVFALNAGEWQPAPQQLAAPRVVTNK